jgi:hypothetical protein
LQSSHRPEKINRITMIHSNAEALRRVNVLGATQIPTGMNGKTHRSENSHGRLRTPALVFLQTTSDLLNSRAVKDRVRILIGRPRRI